MKKLTEKQKNFLRTYLLTGNGTQSYLKHYKCSTASAQSSASILIKKPMAQAYLAKLRDKAEDKAAEKAVASANEILHEDSMLALHRVPGCFDENGILKDLADWPEALQASIKSIEYEDVIRTIKNEDGSTEAETVRVIKKIHFHDKGAALGRMEKALGLVKDEGVKNETNNYDIRVILAKIDGQDRGKLPQDCG